VAHVLRKAQPASLDRLPASSFFLVSAVFHYLGPALAVLLFSHVPVLGMAWLRIVTAAVVFAVWRRPWRLFRGLGRSRRWLLIQLGVLLAAMNTLFYLALARLPLATVGAIEFLGTILLAAAAARSRRNVLALALTTIGVAAITEIQLAGQPLGFVLAFGNCLLFMRYVVLGHRIASSPDGIGQLAAAMLVAAVVVTPYGLGAALTAFTHPVLLVAGAGVGVCSSVIPYVTDQLAMARLPRGTYALMLALLPMFATIIGAVVLRQVPTAPELAGIGLVIAGVAVHQAPREKPADDPAEIPAGNPVARRR